MLPASEIAAYSVVVGMLGSFMLRIDEWVHSPASLKKDIDDLKKSMEAFEKRFDLGDDEFSHKMSEFTVKVFDIDRRIIYLEAFQEARNISAQRPRGRD